MGKKSNTWKAKCVKRGKSDFWDIGDIICIEDNKVQYITDCLGVMLPEKTGILRCDKFIGITDLNFKISGEWELITDEPEQIKSDNINPNHYKSQCSLECIDAMIMAFGSDVVYHFCICNAWKYMWRYQNKNGQEDIGKARWYLEKAKELGFDQPEVYNLEYVLEKIENEISGKE